MKQSPRLRAIIFAHALSLLLAAPSVHADVPAPTAARGDVPSADREPEAAALSRANGPDWAFGSAVGEMFLALSSALSLATITIPQQVTGWAPSSERHYNETLGTISDFTGSLAGTGIAMVGGFGLEVAYYQTNGADSPFIRALRTSLIEAEAVAMTSGITIAIKSLTGRCRPHSYENGACVDGHNDGFPSGHTSAISAVAGVRLINAVRSRGKSTARYLSFALAEAASIATGALRVGSGAHSWEDVLAGWGIGHLTGAAMALAHTWLPVPGPVRPLPFRDLEGAAHASELPRASPKGASLGATWKFHF